MIPVPTINSNIPNGEIILLKSVDKMREFAVDTFRLEGGYTATLKREVNYGLDKYDSYGPNQRIEFRGWTLSIQRGYFAFVQETFDSLHDFDDVFERLNKSSRAKCKHSNRNFVKQLGRCYRQYKCDDCGSIFNIDSSD